MHTVPYLYKHMPIGGGGYVTGFFFHPTQGDVLYCRTDIGGMYRFDYEHEQWVSLIDHVSPEDLRECCPISAALDPTRPGRLYVVGGMRNPDSKALLTISDDFGAAFRKVELPVFAHGNLHGRGAGERLVVEEGDPSTLWFATQADGLWVSRDEGSTWARVEALPEDACTFAASRGHWLLVGTEGVRQRSGDVRGNSLYASFDGGVTFAPVPQPTYETVEGSRLHGIVAQRCAFDDRYLYVSFSANGPRSQNVERGYTCDCGDCSCGRFVRYALLPDGLGAPEDITPEKGNWGFSAADARHGLLVTATIHRQDGDAVYLSQDRGESWKKVLHGLHTGRMDFRLSYMKPCYNGGGNLIHWLTDVKLDPHRRGTAWFNTGTGTFRTADLLADTVIWQDWCDGMEETVHINVHAPASGRVKLLDMIGDLGGFAFTDTDFNCENSFADAEGNRYITCLSCAWPDSDPDQILVTARGNWTGRTKGGLIVSRDGAQSWTRLAMPTGLSPELDALLAKISGVNTNAGWAAVSADGNSYVWAVAERIWLHARNVIVSHNGGRSFARSRVLAADGTEVQGRMKPIADRVLPQVFYGFGENGQLYVSTDGGDSFRQRPAPEGFPAAEFGLVDCADQTELRAAAGEPGVVYAATGQGGLWKLCYHPDTDAFEGRRLTAPGDRVSCVGLGLGRPGGNYAAEPKALYFNGWIGGEYGFWRSFDDCTTIQRINTEKQMFGRVHSIDGDKRIFGRFYLGTGSSGLLYGDEV